MTTSAEPHVNRIDRRPGPSLTLASALCALGSTATLGAALFFQHVLGYMPCALCLEQRIPYHVAIPLSLLACALAAAPSRTDRAARAALAAVGVAMLVSAALGVRHAGVEWGAWPGPSGCAIPALSMDTGDLLGSLDAVHPPSCTEASWRFLGLSFAGWNVVASIALAAVAFLGATAGRGAGGRGTDAATA